jgi:acyl carrier protein
MAEKFDAAKAKEEIRKLISDITEVPIEEITDSAQFVQDLGVDSMVALEIVASIEKKYRVAIPEEKIPTIRCLGDVCNLLQELVKE